MAGVGESEYFEMPLPGFRIHDRLADYRLNIALARSAQRRPLSPLLGPNEAVEACPDQPSIFRESLEGERKDPPRETKFSATM